MSRQGDAHLNGDCWPPLCPICEHEDSMAEQVIRPGSTTPDADA